jgi:hypothetical protein
MTYEGNSVILDVRDPQLYIVFSDLDILPLLSTDISSKLFASDQIYISKGDAGC